MINRRTAIASSILGAAGAAMVKTGAAAAPPPDNATPVAQTGSAFAPLDQSNPLDAKIIAFNTVSPSVDASIRYYRDVIGMTLADEGSLGANVSGAPGIGKAGRRYATLTMPNTPSAMVRVFEAPAGAVANRPRPNSGPMDPGLLIMEGGTSDPAESYHRLASAGTPVITPPRYYFFRNTAWGRDVDVMSYAAFGPGGEQMFITANVRSDRPPWKFPGLLHSGFNNMAVTTLDQRPSEVFYEKALGLKRTSQMEANENNNNDLIGAPRGSYYLWGNVGSGVSIEIWQFNAKTGTMYPTSMDRTGLAMVTMRVNDLAKCRAMCQAAGVRMMGQGALPLPGKPRQDGFVIRGAVGELIEVVPA